MDLLGAGRRDVERGEPVQFAFGDVEAGVDHAERLEDASGEELVEWHARHHLDHPSEHVRGHAVVPLPAGLEQQREVGEAVADVGEVGAGRRAPLEAGAAVELVDWVGPQEPVREAGRVGEEVPELHLFRDRIGDGLRDRAPPPHPSTGERRDVTADGIGQFDPALLPEHQRSNRGDRLRHRVDAEHRVERDGLSRLDVSLAVRVEVNDLALSGDRQRPAREQAVIDVAAEVRRDPRQALGRATDLVRVHFDLQLGHETPLDQTCTVGDRDADHAVEGRRARGIMRWRTDGG